MPRLTPALAVSPEGKRIPVPYSTAATRPVTPLISISSARSSDGVSTTGSLRWVRATVTSSSQGSSTFSTWPYRNNSADLA